MAERQEQLSASVLRFDQSGALLRKIMETAAVGMLLIAPDGRLLYVNEAFARMVGMSVETCLGLHIGDFRHPDCDAQLPLHLDRLMAGEVEDHRTECRLRHADGGPLWMLASAALIRSERTGNPLYVVLQLTNIDRQKQAEAALTYSESRWNFALEAARQGVWDHDVRADRMFYSRTWRTMRGFAPDAAVDFSREAWLARVHPDDVPKILSTVDKQDSGEEGFDTLEYRERHLDGHYIWILSRGRPVKWGADGRPTRTIGTDTDITRLKTVEAALAGEKERLAVTLESIADGVISTDADGRVTFMNSVAETMTGWPLGEATGQPIRRVFHTINETSGLEAPSPVENCLRGNRTCAVDEDAILVGRDGDKRDVRSTAAPLRTPEGAVFGSVLVFQDVSSSRTLQRQLAHSAHHDALTGLPNRVAFERALSQSIDSARTETRHHALCFIDLDHFKAVNDTAGHAAGDALLAKVAELIRNNSRRQDFAARIGGDEFALLLADCPLHGAQRVTQQIVEDIAAFRFRWNGETYSIGASIGLTGVDGTTANPMELMGRADAACYLAKAEGKGRVSLVSL